jgi:hypothetical protein
VLAYCALPFDYSLCCEVRQLSPGPRDTDVVLREDIFPVEQMIGQRAGWKCDDLQMEVRSTYIHTYRTAPSKLVALGLREPLLNH